MSIPLLVSHVFHLNSQRFFAQAKGLMFDIRADQDVVIKEIRFFSNVVGNGIVEVYWRQGSYRGFELSSSGWDLAYERDTDYYNREKLGVLDELEIPIPEGSTVGFFIFMQIDKIRYENTEASSTAVGDNNIQILDGVGVNYSTKWVGNDSNLFLSRAFRGNIM